MKLESQVCSRDLAIRLKELKVKQRSLFVWVPPHGKDTEWFLSTSVFALNIKGIRVGDGGTSLASAFTVAELGEMLPKFCYSQQVPSDTESNRWECDAPEGLIEDTDERFLADTEADARAKMLIYLIENKLITV